MNDKSFADDDALDREKFGDLLYAFLRSEYLLADDSFVVALTGGFGSGKSHFLEMWENKIRSLKEPKPQIVHLNAWESDHSGEPILAIVSAIAKQLAASASIPGTSLDVLKLSAARVARGSMSLIKDAAIGYLETKTGVKLEDAWETIKEDRVKDLLNKGAMVLFEDFEARQQAIDDLREELSSLVEGRAELRLIIVVDELDRCRPTYAIEFLEALKHFLNVKGIAVLIAVDWDQLSSTARALFGGDLVIEEYFRKFVSRKVPLPAPDPQALQKLISKLWNRLFSSEELTVRGRFSCSPSLEHLGDIPVDILMALGVHKPRQIETIFGILAHFCLVETQPFSGSKAIGRNFIPVLFLLGLLVDSPDRFEQFSKNTISAADALQLVFSVTLKEDLRHNWDPSFIEKSLLEAIMDRNNCAELQTAYMARLSELQRQERNQRQGALTFSSSAQECPMVYFARKIQALERFTT
jgi:hypothetical protein